MDASTLYTTAPSMTERIRAFLTECKTANVPWRRAAILAAIAGPESSCCAYAERRVEAQLISDPPCWPTRPVLVLERGSTRLGEPLPKAWLDDPEAMSMLKSRGYLANNGRFVQGEANTIDRPWIGKPNNAIAYMLEWVIDKRKGPLLGAFGMGMTQMFLALSPLAGGKLASRFGDWDKLFKFYTYQSGAAIANDESSTYLPLTGAYPTPDTSDEANKGYLSQYQTGTNVDWDGAWASYYATFRNALVTAWSLGASMSYPNLK